MELIKHKLTNEEVKATESMPISNRNLVVCRQEKNLNGYTQNQLKSVCLEIITVAFVENSPNGISDPNILSEQATLLEKELTGKFRTLTVSEIKTAFKNGIRGEYGEFFGLCPKTYHKFLKAYLNNPERGKAWIEYQKLIDANQVKEKIMYTQEQLNQWCVDAFADFIRDKTMPIYPRVIYDNTKILLNRKSLVSDLQIWEEIVKIAKVEYKVKIKPLPKDLTKDWRLDMDVNLMYQSCLKSVALRFFYNDLVSKGITNLRDVK